MLLKINNLTVDAKIGCYAWEKVITQKVFISLQLEVEQVIDYCLIAEYIKNFVIQSHYNFIEELTNALFIGIKKEFNISCCSIELHKSLCISNAESAAIVIKSH